MTGLEIAAGAAIQKVFEWAWSHYGKDLTDGAKKTLKEKFQFKSASEAYAKKMKKRYGQMQLWKMSAPTSVEKIFTQVNILQKQSAFRNIPKTQLEDIYLNQAGFGEIVEKGKDGILAVKEADRLFILGKPGAGKTTFLKHITLEAIKGRFEAIPIFITLRELSESKQSLMDFLIEQFDICGFPEAKAFIESILKQGKAIVLFDGLDEVRQGSGLRKEVIRAIKKFSDKYDQSKIVITCRVAASEYLFEGFSIVEMADFDEAQIKTFVTKWFSDDPEKSERFFVEFEKYDGSRLRDQAKSPLLLTLLCIIFEESQHFPARRSEIYKEALDVLLKSRDASRNIERDPIYDQLSSVRKKGMFAHIAFETFEKGSYLFEKRGLEKKIVSYLQSLPSAEIEENIDGEAVLKAIVAQHGIFVERAKGVYSFAHLSFQEYYAAHYVVSEAESHLSRLFAFNPRPWDIFLLTTEMLDNADSFFELFIGQLNYFASKEVRLNALLKKGNRDYLVDRKVSFFLIIKTAEGLSVDLGPRSQIPCVLLDLNFSRDRILDRILDFSSTFADIISLARRCVLNHTEDIIYDHDRNLSLTIDLDKILKSSLREVLEKSQERGVRRCHQSLLNLSLPRENMDQETRQKFADALLDIFKATFRIEDYEFKMEEVQKIYQYLDATKLLLDCLKVAYVSDRAAIEDQLLRPVN